MALVGCGFGGAAKEFMDAEEPAKATYLRDGHRRLFERSRLDHGAVPAYLGEAIAATERVAVAFGIDLEVSS
jgi:hypothetical protein